MAQIVLSGKELVCILRANGVVPSQITEIRTDGEIIRIRVDTQWHVLKSVHLSMRFVGFEQGHVILQLVTNHLVDAFGWLVEKMVNVFPLEDFAGRWEYPLLYIDVNALLRRQVRGTEVTNVVFQEDRFHITTVHSVETEPCEGTVAGTPPP